eukprot:1169663-Rhodomonas_salina.1
MFYKRSLVAPRPFARGSDSGWLPCSAGRLEMMGNDNAEKERQLRMEEDERFLVRSCWHVFARTGQQNSAVLAVTCATLHWSCGTAQTLWMLRTTSGA